VDRLRERWDKIPMEGAAHAWQAIRMGELVGTLPQG